LFIIFTFQISIYLFIIDFIKFDYWRFNVLSFFNLDLPTLGAVFDELLVLLPTIGFLPATIDKPSIGVNSPCVADVLAEEPLEFSNLVLTG